MYICDICGKSYKSKANLKCHHYDVHMKKEKNFKCHCGKVFPTNARLKKHENVHKTKLFSCNLCNLSFTRKSDLMRHNVTVHLKPYIYSCAFCSKKYNRVDNLYHHVKSKHN